MLKEHIGNSSVITVIGLCKNAGKTTALRRLLDELSGERLALTSVGRDGESTDLVTGTEKPALYIKAGDLFATARGTLPLCDCTCKVEVLTDIATPLGDVVVLRAMSDGFVQLAGPSSAGQLASLNQLFFELGAQRVLIDGAAGRKSLAAAGTAGCTILCAGASFDRDMDTVVAETAHVSSLFRLPLSGFTPNQEDQFALFTPDGQPLPLETDESGIPLWRKLPRTPCALWLRGAVTDTILKALTQQGVPITVITPDPTHILAGRETTAAFTQCGGTLNVLRPLNLAAVCANPHSVYDWSFPAASFLSALESAVPLPVVNVFEED